VPIFVGGVLKAWGLPVVQRGARAVQVTELSRPARGTRESAFQESPVSTARSSVCDPIDSEPASEDSAVCGGIIDEPTGSRSAIALPPPTDDEHAMLAALRDTLGDVPAQVTIELGRVTLPLGELLHLLAPGCIIPLERSALAPLEVRVSDKLVARAEAVAHGERYEVRITELVVGAR
jgi:flagellar motor switch protein FliN